MARPIKSGLDYFPLDTALDDNFELVEAKFGPTGFMVVIKLYQKIYATNGYYYPWGEHEQLLFSKRINVSINSINDIIEYCLTIGIFSDDMYEKGVLTSHGIQKRYIDATLRRKELTFCSDLLLIDHTLIPVVVGKNTRSIIFISYINTQSKGKERKGKEIESIATVAEIATEPVFSKSEALNLNTQTSEQRFQQLKAAWNANCKPSCNIKSTLYMSYTQRDEWLAGESQIINIFDTFKAIQNYGGILSSSEYEIDGHKGYSMLSFLVKGVQWYTDEAKPFDRCRIKAPTTRKEYVPVLAEEEDFSQ